MFVRYIGLVNGELLHAGVPRSGDFSAAPPALAPIGDPSGQQCSRQRRLATMALFALALAEVQREISIQASHKYF
jgi:hypothetical protein